MPGRWGKLGKGRVVLILVVVAALVATGLYVGLVLPSAKAGNATQPLAPTFSLTTIYGQNFNLTDYRTNSVVLIEFTSLSCSECQIVEQSLKTLYTNYNATGTTNVQIVSIYIEPQFGDTIPALKAYHAKNNITWTMAQDTPSLSVSRSYGVSDIPNVVMIDKQGRVVYQEAGAQSTSQLQSSIAASLAGTATPISLVTVSVFSLAAIAGVSTFFSPCAFPMFPGYMGLFLGLNATKSESTAEDGTTYKGAARRAVAAGSVTALGMIVVFLLVGVALILAASTVSGYIPYLLIVVGAILVGLGALLLTNIQYWRIVAPLQSLWQRLRGEPPGYPVIAEGPTSGKGFYLKLFSYGMGYAAAAAGSRRAGHLLGDHRRARARALGRPDQHPDLQLDRRRADDRGHGPSGPGREAVREPAQGVYPRDQEGQRRRPDHRRGLPGLLLLHGVDCIGRDSRPPRRGRPLRATVTPGRPRSGIGRCPFGRTAGSSH